MRRAPSPDFKFPGRGQRNTPITDARGMVTILNLLPGRSAAAFRAASADVMVRFLGGDPTLVSEIKRNAERQLLLPADATARIFGEDVQARTVQETRVMLRSAQLSPIDIINGLGLCREDEGIAMELLENEKHMVTSRFMESHVMYLCLTNLKVPGMPDRLVMKIGYSADFVNRMPDLLTEYRCGMMLLCGMVPVRNEQFEKNFHRLLAARFPESVCSMKIGNVEVASCTSSFRMVS